MAEYNLFVKKVRDAVDGIRQKRAGGKSVAGKSTGASPYRTQYLSFLRSCWNNLPNVRYLEHAPRYRCVDKSYREVVEVVATAVHEFLFLGLTHVEVFGFNEVIELCFVSGKFVLFLYCCSYIVFCLAARYCGRLHNHS